MATRIESLAALFNEYPHVWIDGRTLANVAGAYAWRTRVSDLRKPPYAMAIENRQRHVCNVDGSGAATISEYRFTPTDSNCAHGQYLPSLCQQHGGAQ